MIGEALDRVSERAGVSRERFIRAVGFTILLVGIIYMIVSALPLKRAYPVKLSSDISAILVKNGTRTLIDVVPESVMSLAKSNPEWSADPLQRQAILNGYGAALNILGVKTRSGFLVVESSSEKRRIGSIVSKAEKDSYIFNSESKIETVWVNNTAFPDVELPSILVSAQGNSDTVALALYFLEVLTGEVWNERYHFKITGALNDPVDKNMVTSIGAASDKAALKLSNNEILYMPFGNKINLTDEQSGLVFVNSLGQIIADICSLPHRGGLCSNTGVVKILTQENAKMQSRKLVAQSSNKNLRG